MAYSTMPPSQKIEIERLDAGVAPPDGEDYIMIEKTTSGTYVLTQAGSVGSIVQEFVAASDALESAANRARNAGMDIIFKKGF
jgi:hypothetical protein